VTGGYSGDAFRAASLPAPSRASSRSESSPSQFAVDRPVALLCAVEGEIAAAMTSALSSSFGEARS